MYRNSCQILQHAQLKTKHFINRNYIKKGRENTHPFYVQITIAEHLSLLVSFFQLEDPFPEKLNQPEAETCLLECQS